MRHSHLWEIGTPEFFERGRLRPISTSASFCVDSERMFLKSSSRRNHISDCQMRGDREDNVKDQSAKSEPHHGHQRKDEGRAVCPPLHNRPAVRRNKHGLVELVGELHDTAVETYKGRRGGGGLLPNPMGLWTLRTSLAPGGFASKLAKTEPSGGCTIVPLWDWRNTSAHAPTQERHS